VKEKRENTCDKNKTSLTNNLLIQDILVCSSFWCFCLTC